MRYIFGGGDYYIAISPYLPRGGKWQFFLGGGKSTICYIAIFPGGMAL